MLSRGDITLVVRNISHPLGDHALPDIHPILPGKFALQINAKSNQ